MRHHFWQLVAFGAFTVREGSDSEICLSESGQKQGEHAEDEVLANHAEYERNTERLMVVQFNRERKNTGHETWTG